MIYTKAFGKSKIFPETNSTFIYKLALNETIYIYQLSSSDPFCAVGVQTQPVLSWCVGSERNSSLIAVDLKKLQKQLIRTLIPNIRVCISFLTICLKNNDELSKHCREWCKSFSQ